MNAENGLCVLCYKCIDKSRSISFKNDKGNIVVGFGHTLERSCGAGNSENVSETCKNGLFKMRVIVVYQSLNEEVVKV